MWCVSATLSSSRCMSTQSPWKYEISISIGGTCIEVNNWVEILYSRLPPPPRGPSPPMGPRTVTTTEGNLLQRKVTYHWDMNIFFSCLYFCRGYASLCLSSSLWCKHATKTNFVLMNHVSTVKRDPFPVVYYNQQIIVWSKRTTYYKTQVAIIHTLRF
jgi:hypothetical protein